MHLTCFRLHWRRSRHGALSKRGLPISRAHRSNTELCPRIRGATLSVIPLFNTIWPVSLKWGRFQLSVTATGLSPRPVLSRGPQSRLRGLPSLSPQQLIQHQGPEPGWSAVLAPGLSAGGVATHRLCPLSGAAPAPAGSSGPGRMGAGDTGPPPSCKRCPREGRKQGEASGEQRKRPSTSENANHP